MRSLLERLSENLVWLLQEKESPLPLSFFSFLEYSVRPLYPGNNDIYECGLVFEWTKDDADDGWLVGLEPLLWRLPSVL